MSRKIVQDVEEQVKGGLTDEQVGLFLRTRHPRMDRGMYTRYINLARTNILTNTWGMNPKLLETTSEQFFSFLGWKFKMPGWAKFAIRLVGR